MLARSSDGTDDLNVSRADLARRIGRSRSDHDRRRQLARRAAESGWSVRNLKAEIDRGAESRPARGAPHPDHVEAAATLEDTISRALRAGVQARVYRGGYQLLLDQAAVERLVRLIVSELPADEPPAQHRR